MIKLLMSYFDLFKQGTMADNFRHIQKDKYIPSLSEGKTSSVCMLTANILINRDKLNFLFFFFFLKSINSFI